MKNDEKQYQAQMKRINQLVRERNAHRDGLKNHPEFYTAARRIADQVYQDAAKAAPGIDSPVRRKAAFLISQIALLLEKECPLRYKNYTVNVSPEGEE